MGYKKSAWNDYLALPYKAFLKCGVTSILTENLMKITFRPLNYALFSNDGFHQKEVLIR